MVHMDRVKRCFGASVLLLGLGILLGADKWLEAQLLQVMPQGWINLTTLF
jgi:hypothetical protein